MQLKLSRAAGCRFLRTLQLHIVAGRACLQRAMSRLPDFVCDRNSHSLQDKFFTQLRNSADGFNVIADFFGRGILNAPAATSH